MTDARELRDLQDKARRAGRVCNFFINEQGHMDSAFYLDPESKGRFKAGMIISLLSFAEIERKKLYWHEKSDLKIGLLVPVRRRA
jgi:hypothetical protein